MVSPITPYMSLLDVDEIISDFDYHTNVLHGVVIPDRPKAATSINHNLNDNCKFIFDLLDDINKFIQKKSHPNGQYLFQSILPVVPTRN